ncbi:MAG TPA: hypothetical protein V6C72_06520 [Chroococcales cyanobacterium]
MSLTRPKRNPDVETKMLPDGNVVLFSTKNEWAHTITPLAAVAWEYCDGNNDLAEIIERVKAISSTEGLVGSDADHSLSELIEALLEELADSGLLQSSE